ncbi:MAG TPA: clostripain-related cysteine peptidase, partial [Blastocatellia bacterium]|nr:clostripain-related cysteine peptidase [Blastocatellia bacterium]
MKNWTVLVYVASDNNLIIENIFDLIEMKKVGTTDNLNLIVQCDFGGETNYPFKFTSGQKDEPLLKDIDSRRRAKLKTLQGAMGVQAQTGEPPMQRKLSETIKEFINTTLAEYESKHYMLVLSGHGSGTVGDFLSADNSGDPYTRDNLSIPELKALLEDITKQDDGKKLKKRKFDILALDSCLMSMAEIGYELRDVAQYLVGAQGFEPLSGWPYANILKEFDTTSNDIESLVKKIVEKYIDYYRDYTLGGLSVDYSAANLSYSVILANAITNLAKSLKSGLDSEQEKDDAKKSLILSHWEAQAYKFEQYVDLYDFCELLMRNNPKYEAKCGKVLAAIRKYIVKSCYSGPAVQYSHGVSIYFPWNKGALLDPKSNPYNDLEFNKKTKWMGF